jgi:hypothetical protein
LATNDSAIIIAKQDAATMTDGYDETPNKFPAAVLPVDETAAVAPDIISDNETTEADSDTELNNLSQSLSQMDTADVYSNIFVRQPAAARPTLSPVPEEFGLSGNSSDFDMDLTMPKHVDTESEGEAEIAKSAAASVEGQPRRQRPAREHRLPARYRE